MRHHVYIKFNSRGNNLLYFHIIKVLGNFHLEISKVDVKKTILTRKLEN